MAKFAIDLLALGGLRGFSSLWIVLYHCLNGSIYPIRLFSIVQIFYLLSGVSLVVAYGSSKQTDFVDSPGDSKMNIWQYYQNRLSRILPVYYFTLILIIPIYFNGFGNFEVDSITDSFFLRSLLVNIIPIQTWLLEYFGYMLNFPAWTVCTLIFMWIFFPYANKILQSKSDKIIIVYMFYCYWFNFFFILLGLYLPYPGYTLFIDTGLFSVNPVAKFPLFFLGMCTGMLCIRHPDDRMPWPTTFLLLFPSFKDHYQKAEISTFFSGSEESQYLIADKNVKSSETALWARRADIFGTFYLLVGIFTTVVFIVSYHYGWDEDDILSDKWNLNTKVNFFICFAQMSLVVALIRGGNDQYSWVINVMRSDIGQWLGDRSMCIYLIHWPIIRYFMWANYGKSLTWPTSYTCSEYNSTSSSDTAFYNNCENNLEDFYSALELPVLGTPIVMIMSVVAAHFLHHYVEEPGRKFFSWKS